MKIKCSFLVLLISLIIASCSNLKDISGIYISNFAVNGYHVRQIKLNPDSTLEFRYSGHLVYDTATANFTRTGNRLELTYFPIAVDTSKWTELRKQGITLMEQEYNRLGKSAPHGLVKKNNKLFLVSEDGQIIKYKSNYKGKNKKYFLQKVSG